MKGFGILVGERGVKLSGGERQGRGMNGRTPLQAFIDGLPPKETETMSEPLAA